MRIIIITIFLFLTSILNAQPYRMRLDSLKIDEKIFLDGFDRMPFFEGLNDSNQITWPQLSPAVKQQVGAAHIENAPDDVTLDLKISGLDTTIGIKSSGVFGTAFSSSAKDTIGSIAGDSARYVISDPKIWLYKDTQTNKVNQTDNLIIDYSWELMGVSIMGWSSYLAADADLWEWARKNDEQNIVYNEPDNAIHGNFVAKIDTNTDDIEYFLWLDLDSLTQYAFSYYRKITVSGSGKIVWHFEFRDSVGASISATTWTQNISSTEGWTKYDTTFTSPTGTEYVKFYLTSEDADWSGATMYLDFISFIPGSSTPDYVDTKDSPTRTMDNQENWYHIENLEVENIAVTGRFKFFIDSTYGDDIYRNPFTIYDYNNYEAFWIDHNGNPWINDDVLFVTRGANGVSAMHIGHDAGSDFISLGTTNSFSIRMNNVDNSIKKLTFWQKNNVDTNYTFIPGKTGFGASSLIGHLYVSVDPETLMALSKVVIDYDSTVIRNIIKYDYTTGLPLYPQRNQFVFINDNPVDIDTMAIYNGYVWKYFTSDSGSYNAEATALFARMSTQPSDDRKEIMNFLIEALKNYQIWQKLDVLYVFANDTADSGEKLFLNWIGDYSNATNVNSITIAPDTGIAGNGSTSYLNTNWGVGDSINYGLHDASMFIYSRTDTSYNLWDYGTFETATNYIGARIKRDNNFSYYHLNTWEFPASPFTGESTGLFAMNIIPGDERIRLYRNGSELGNAGTGTKTMSTYDLYICCVNKEGTPLYFTDRQYSVFGIGAGLTAAQHLKLKEIIEYYLDAPGV